MMVKGTPPVMNASLQRTSAQPPAGGLGSTHTPMKLTTGGVVHLPKAFAAGAMKWGHTPHFNTFLHAYSDRIRASARNKMGKGASFTRVGKAGKGGGGSVGGSNNLLGM